ncbi:MAG TPA: hypothetical protein VIX81_00050, partial [Gammaproteobacteria bacterium]
MVPKSRAVYAALLLSVLLLPAALQAAVPRIISFQGHLERNDTAALPATVPITIEIFDQRTEGDP